MDDVVIIRLDERDAECIWCGEPCSVRYGLPMYEGEIVANDYPGEWAGFDACERCFLIHEAGGPELLARTVPREAVANA